MKCEESRALIEEYFDGELETHTSMQVSVHLENCFSCKSELQQLGLEDRLFQKYERGVEPSPALWAGVRVRIAEELPVQRPLIWERWQAAVTNLMSLRFNLAVAAVLVLSAVVGTVTVMKYLDSKQAPIASATETRSEVTQPTGPAQLANDPKASGATAVSSKAPEIKKRNLTGMRPGTTLAVKSSVVIENSTEAQTPSQLVRAAEKNYLSAIAMLKRDAAQRPSQLDSETRAKLEGALTSIDRTISATRRAVKQNPNDPLAVQYMLTAYAKKVDVLKEMTSY